MTYPNRFKKGLPPLAHKDNCNCFRCTKTPWNKGIQRTSEEKEKISKGMRGNQNHFINGKISYSGIHKWIAKRLPKPSKCPNCRLDKRLELSNNSRKYLRNLSDWEWLCHRCHGFKDGWIGNMKSSLL